ARARLRARGHLGPRRHLGADPAARRVWDALRRCVPRVARGAMRESGGHARGCDRPCVPDADGLPAPQPDHRRSARVVAVRLSWDLAGLARALVGLAVIDAIGPANVRSFWLAGHSQGGATSRRIVCTPLPSWS